MLPPRSTPGTPWQITQWLTYRPRPAGAWAGSYFTPDRKASCWIAANGGGGALPPSADVNTVPGPIFSLARCEMPYEPPQPTAIETYCLPSTTNVDGAAITPVPVGDCQSCLPVLALNAMNRPSAVPWNTRLPPVVSVPPFHGEMCSTRQTS